MADMVPDEIEPAERVRGAPHYVAGETVGAQIADQRQRAPTRSRDLADNRLDAGLVDIGHPDRRTLACETQRPGPSHSGRRRRDDADLVFEPHDAPPRCPLARCHQAELSKGGASAASRCRRGNSLVTGKVSLPDAQEWQNSMN